MGRCFIYSHGMKMEGRGIGTVFCAIQFKIDKDMAKNVVIFNKEI